MKNLAGTSEVAIRDATSKDDGAVAYLIHGFPSPEAIGIAGGRGRAAALGLALFGAGLGCSAGDETYLATLSGETVGVLLGRCAAVNFPIPALAVPALLRCIFGLYNLSELPMAFVTIATSFRSMW